MEASLLADYEKFQQREEHDQRGYYRDYECWRPPDYRNYGGDKDCGGEDASGGHVLQEWRLEGEGVKIKWKRTPRSAREYERQRPISR